MFHDRNFHRSAALVSAAGLALCSAGGAGWERKDGEGGGGPTDAEKAALAIKAAIDTKLEEIKGIAEDALGKAKGGESETKSAKEKADEALTGFNTLKAQLEALEQKNARPGGEGGDDVKSLGEQFTESDEMKALAADPRQRGVANFETKATITLATSVGAQTTRLPGVLELPQRRMTVRDLISPGQMSGNSLEYLKEEGFTNNAAPVAENAQKPESDFTLEAVTTSARVIAHYMKASRQVLDDMPQLRSIIDNRLLYGLAFREEAQLLNGDGTGQNLLGIIPQAVAYAAPGGLVADTLIDRLRLAMLQAVLAEYPATGHVLNPIDWARIEMLKDELGRYLIGNPQGTAQPTLWGLPVVATQAIAQDKFLTGAFKLGAQLFDRWQARVQLATENENDFTNNRVTVLAEERLALAVYRPECFIYGDFGLVA